MAVRDRLRVFLTKHVMPNLPSKLLKKTRGPFPGVQKNIPLKLDSTDAVKREMHWECSLIMNLDQSDV